MGKILHFEHWYIRIFWYLILKINPNTNYINKGKYNNDEMLNMLKNNEISGETILLQEI